MHNTLIHFIIDVFDTNDIIPLHAPFFGGNEKSNITDTIDSTFVSSVGAYVDAFESELLNKQIRHDGNPVLTMCMSNAVVTKDPAGNRKLDKHKATGRIDGAVAAAMARGQAARTSDNRVPVSPWEDENFTIGA